MDGISCEDYTYSLLLKILSFYHFIQGPILALPAIQARFLLTHISISEKQILNFHYGFNFI